MDTKQLEQIGETYIVSKLLDADILVAKPFFDRLGADLIGFTSIDDKAKFCRIQCKYRELKTKTFVEIDSSYVIGSFVLFLYIKYSGSKHFYCLLPDDISRIFVTKNKEGNELFKLSITKKVLKDLDDDLSISFTPGKVTNISELMKASSTDTEFRRIVKGLLHNYKELSEKQRKHTALKQLLHDLEINKLENESLEERIAILKEYRWLMKKYCEDQVQKKKGMFNPPLQRTGRSR